jgi:uncharacterized NAD(P)/FAD-binding protein YdhS/glyoxylase-like metal-dependent hydrolase (beta-lactamase superfamily II)
MYSPGTSVNSYLPTTAQTTIAIVGGGFSGSLVATHLLKTATQPLSIKLIERSRDIGKGVAYSTESTCHLLNVSAGNMSAFSHDPGHFLRWLNHNQTELSVFLPDEVNASTFIPRRVYAFYIQSVLEEAEATTPSYVQLERVIDEVVAVEPDVKGAIVSLRSSRSFQADKVVLALGNAPAAIPQAKEEHQGYWRNAWSADALTDLDANASVLLIGTGLTMVDMVLSLRDRQHQGKVYAVSRRGLAPQQHQASKPYPPFLTSETAPKTVRELVRRIRTEIKVANAQGYGWRSVIDALRPITQKLWQQLPISEQQRFLRHLTPYWDVHRHRIAQRVGDTVNDMLNSGQLTITAGRIQNYQVSSSGVAVTVRPRRATTDSVLHVNRVVNCTGISVDYRQSSNPLIADLRDQGLIHPNCLGLGLDTAANGAILDAKGNSSTWLYTLGTPRKGDLWESIAVPELRGQAQALAETVLRSLPVRVRPVPPAPLMNGAMSDRTAKPAPSTLLFRQFFDPETSSYTYLIADRQTGDAVLVDAVLEQVDRDLQTLNDLGLTLRYCLETHLHADHITGAGKLRQQTGCQVLVPQNTAVTKADRSLAGGETLTVGAVVIEAIATPGHTSSHIAYLVNKTHLLTGDALLIRGCGRTDFQGGDAGTLYDVVTQQLFTLPDETLLYPAHDYNGRTVSTIGEEKRLNPRFADRTRQQFITIMNSLNLSYPKKMNQAVPANEYCGDFISEEQVNFVADSATSDEQDKAELNLLTNAEIHDYFAMYI